MKNFLQISKLFHDEVMSRSSRGQVEGNTCVEHFSHKALMLLFAVFVMSIGQMWGATATISATQSNGYSSSCYLIPDGTAISAITGAGGNGFGNESGPKAKITVTRSKKTATLTFTINSGITITSFKVNGESNNNVIYDLDGTSVTIGTALTGLSKTSSMVFTLTCTDESGTSNRNTKISSIVLTYTTGGGGGGTGGETCMTFGTTSGDYKTDGTFTNGNYTIVTNEINWEGAHAKFGNNVDYISFSNPNGISAAKIYAKTANVRVTYSTATDGSTGTSQETISVSESDYTQKTLTVPANTKYIKLDRVPSTSTYVNQVCLTESEAAPSSCTGTYSFHSKNSSSTWEDPICFAQVGSSTTYMTDEVYLPTDGVSFKVGWEGSDDAARAKTSEKDWYYMIMGPRGTRGSGGYWIAGRHTTSENTGGAKGRFYLYSDNNEDNKYVGFTPTGYKLRFGKGESWTSYAFSPNEGATDEATDWRTGLVTLNSDNADYHTYVGLETSSDYVWTDHSEDDRHVFLDVTTNWGNDGVTNFAVYCWDGTGNDRWCLMTAVPGVTKLYEGWLPNTYNYLKFVRLKSSTCSFDNAFNTTGDLSLLDGKNLFTITDWGTGSWGVYEKTGKFRMWANSTSQNWYVHFYPYNVLTYNANTGSGTMTPQSVAADAGSKNVTVLANGFTAPTGYQFDHWDTAPDGSGTDYAPGATYNLTADATLYAIWSPIPVSSITVSPASKTLDVGDTQTLTATVAPATALDKAVTWSTGNGSIATVSSTGLVTAVAPGSCTITATAHDGSGVTGTCDITVNKLTPTKYSFSVDKEVLCGEETATLTLEDSEVGVTYELREDSSHPIAETQKTGTGSALTWTGLGAGTYVVYAVADATYIERQMDGSKITVSAGTATSITTQPTNQEVTVGEEATLTVEAAGTSLSYQWKESATEGGTYSDVSTGSGKTSASYRVTPAAAGTKWYKCVVTGTCGEVTTEARKIVANAAVTYTVTYVYNGADGGSQPASATGSSVSLPNPTKTGYKLQGWYTSSGSLAGAATATYNPTSNITLYALWREDDCAGGGGGGTAEWSYYFVDPDAATEAGVTNASAIFTSMPSSTSTAGSNMNYTIGEVTLSSAKWKYNNAITSGTTFTTLVVPSGYKATNLQLAVNPGGSNLNVKVYNSSDEEVGASGSVANSDGAIATIGEDLAAGTYSVKATGRNCGRFYAIAVELTPTGGGEGECYYVTYNGNGADGGFTTDEASHPSGSDVTVKTNSFTKTGYRFTGWKTEPSGGTSYAAGGTISGISSNMILYAQWEEDVCSAPELSYATASVEKNVGDAAFTNTLTNPHSLVVTYSSSATGVATVNETSGMVTIVGAGETTITATWAGNATYCAGTATYTLNVSSGCTPQSLSKVSATKGTSGTVTGYNDGQYAGDAVVKLYDSSPQSASLPGVGSVDGYKMGDAGSSIVFATLKGTSFQAGDKVRIGITKKNDTRTVDASKDILTIYYGTSKSDATALHTITGVTGAGFYEYTLTLADVTAIGSKKGIGLFRESDNGENPYVYSVEIIGCREWASCTAPDAVAVGSVTGEGATFTITDAENTNNYEIYYSESSTAPTAETSATVSGISSKSRAVTGLTAETTYYYWVRSNCGGATKSSWVAGTPTSFTTSAAAATHNVTYNGNGSTGGSVPEDDNDYEEGDVVTVLGNTGSLEKDGQTFLGWSTNSTASSGTFYPAGYKFYMPNAAVTLYAVWGSTGCETLVNVAANSSTTVSATVGSATVNNPSSQGYAGAIKLNSSGYIELTPKAGSSFAAGNKITITMYCGADASKTIGFRLANKDDGNSMSASVAKRTEKTFEYTLVSGDITSGKIKIYRYGSESWFVSAIVEDCTGGGATGYTVTFNMNGHGSAIEPIANVPSGSKIGAPIPAPTAVGYEFGGWYKEAGCSNEWDFASDVVSTDKTLYAQWTGCAPSISAHPVAATYTKDAVATALSVTASGDDLNYQWYTSEDASADISGSSAIPGATSASYTPSTSLLGTIYYFCVVSNTCGNAVSNKAAITVNDSKPAPTAVWTVEEPKEGGKGFTFSIEVNKNNGDNWDGELLASMLTLSDNAILDASIVVNNTNKTISGTYGVKAGSSSPVTFYLLLPATATQSATRLDHDRTFTPCAGGAGDSYNVPVRKDYEKDASNNYRWVTPGAGEITYAVSSSISSVKAASTVASVFDYIMSGDKQFVWVKTYEANTKTIRLHVETSGANISVNALYKNTVYATAADKDIVSSDDYTVSYDGSGSAENTGTKGTHYMDITFDSPLAANDIICVKFSSSKVKAYGAVLTTVGDGGDQTTSLAWNTPSPSTPVTKNEDAADFSFTANRSNTEAQKSLGEISYSSSNTAVATVNATTGLVHIADAIDFGAADYKEVTITATLAASGCYKKASITYTLRVNKYVCPDKPGIIEVTATNCSSQTLRVSGYEEGASIKWYRNGSEIPSATSAEYTAMVAGEYYVVTHKTCDITSTNSINVTFATASAEKIVDQWYVKNGRRTPDIALVQTTNATSFTVTSGGTPIENIGGCTFELKKDGIIYLHGQKEEDGSAPSDMTAGDMTITITVSGCAGALSGLDITIHKQAETAKPSVAFVVDGTLRKDGGTATSVSEAKTSDRDLWKYLNNTYALTGCNVYWSVDSKELREYYSQFDAILITDDPNTQTKGTGSVPYVKAFGTMVDVRPILTMEAYVGRYSDGGWHVYNASPSSPNPRQVELKLECKNHDIFKGLDPETSDNVRVTRDEYNNEYWHVIMVDTTVAPYHNTSKDYAALPALQGFDKTKFSNMLGVGTIAEETLQAGVERQEEPAARMMILGIQNEAMAALTNEGKLIVKNAIEYLLKTNMEDVNDCANYFTGGPSGTGDNWATPENWSSGKVPDFESRVRILRPVVISGGTKAIVARVDIATSGKSKWVDGECNGKVTVNSQGALIVGGKIRRAEAPHFGIDNLMPTENSDLIVRASSAGTHYQGALIHDNTDGLTHAEVEMWNPSHWEVEGGKKKKYWSYVAVPIQEADIPNFFWHGFTYLYNETSGWEKKFDGSSLYPFQGIGASLQTGNIEWFYGPLATTENQDITLTYTADKGEGMNLIGNSWTAPIQIANFEEDDFGDAAAEVWVFNTGHEKEEGTGSGSSTTVGQWNAIPINSAGLPGYEGLKVIPAMQAFEVNTTVETTLHLDYDRLVRAGRENLNEPMRAPRRSAAKEIEATMRVRVSGELTHTDVYLLKDARFSDGFDNGWDGHYLSGDDRSAQLYAISEEEGKLAFLAQPEIEGTVLGFAPSKDGNEYTFSFSYDGDEEYYLNDLKLTSSTLISNESSYLFTYEAGDTNRFYISRQPLGGPAITTGVDEVREEAKPRKFIYNDKMYILFNGRVFDATGKAVK